MAFMSFLNPFKGKKLDDYFLAIDLGSAEVKVAVYRTPSEFENAKFVGVGRQRHGLSTMRYGRIADLDAVIETTNLAIEEAQLHAGQVAEQAVVGVSGGALYAKGLRVRTSRADPDAIITEEEFDSLAEQIEEKTLQKAQAELEEAYGTKFQRIETSFTAYLIDGAKVRTPLGLSGSDFEVAVLHYFIEEDSLRTIESLAQELGFEILSLVATSVNLSATKIEQYFDSILVDIGGDVTEVVVVKSGKMLTSELFFWGGRDFTDQIAHDLSVTYDEAEALKVDFTMGHLDFDRAQAVKKSLESSISWWVEGVASTLGDVEVSGLPETILLAGQSRYLQELKGALLTYPWEKELDFSAYPKIEVMGGKYPGLQALTKIEL